MIKKRVKMIDFIKEVTNIEPVQIEESEFICMFLQSETFKIYDPDVHDLAVLIILFVSKELGGRKLKVEDAKRIAQIIEGNYL